MCYNFLCKANLNKMLVCLNPTCGKLVEILKKYVFKCGIKYLMAMEISRNKKKYIGFEKKQEFFSDRSC